MERKIRPDLLHPLDADKNEHQRAIVFCAINWCKGVLIQAERIVQTLEKLDRLPENASNESRGSFSPYSLIDRHFFLTATVQAMDWCRLTAEIFPEFTALVEVFCSNEQLKITRNMCEHAVNCAKGQGHSKTQKEYVIEASYISEDTKHKMIIQGAETLIGVGNRIWIGGRVDLSETIVRTKEMLAALVSFFKTQWPGFLD